MQRARRITHPTGVETHVDDRLLDFRQAPAVAIDIIANNPIAQKVVELSSSQPYSLVEHSLYRFVCPPQGV